MVYAENVLICIAVPLAISLLFTKRSTSRFIASFLVGMIVCLLSAYISGYFTLSSGYSAEDTSIFLSPIVEELMKFLPVLFVYFVFESNPQEIQPNAIGIGAGFATFENCCFILSSGAQNLAYVLVRGSAVGVMHLVTMVALAMGLRLIKNYQLFSLAGLLGVLSLSMTFHGLYNLLVSEPGIPTYIGYALPMVCAVVLYLIYHEINQQDEEEKENKNFAKTGE